MTTRRSLSPTLLLVALALVVGGVAAACSGATSTTSLGASCDDFAKSPAISETAEVKIGGEITITLCSNPSTGYSWEQPTIADPAVASLVATGSREPNASPDVVGAAGTQLVTLRGDAAGTTTVSFAYSQPWDGGEKGAWTYEVTLTVK